MGREPKNFRALFNDDMARAIVEGHKTVTRRPVIDARNGGIPPDGSRICHHHRGAMSCFALTEISHWSARMPCAPGDLLIGRECFALDVPGCDFQGGMSYRADHVDKRGDGPAHPMKWRPSIHMPDWAARIRRRVVSVTVERLQDITEDDAVREGFGTGEELFKSFRNYAPPGLRIARPRDKFEAAWDTIYAPKNFGWAANPWVWRIEFSAKNVPTA